jgi:hypothetical protein
MRLRSAVWIVLVGCAVYGGWQRFAHRPASQPDGVVAPDDPLQSDARDTTPVRFGRWLLTPRADYDITARILSTESYHFDPLSDLIPEDLALGWGPMSDNRILADFEISQSVRFYTWRPRAPLPIARASVISHSANTHVIPADARIRAQLQALRVGDVVRLTGTLVDGTRDDGAWIRTSLTRLDSGPGACEIMLVEAVELKP